MSNEITRLKLEVQSADAMYHFACNKVKELEQERDQLKKELAEAKKDINCSGFYAASKVKHARAWRKLRSCGEPVSASWIDEAEEGQTADYAELALRCIEEIRRSEFVLLYCKPGEILKGALIEAGCALALGKEVRCVGNCDSLSRVFRCHPLWREFESIDSAIAQKKGGAE